MVNTLMPIINMMSYDFIYNRKKVAVQDFELLKERHSVMGIIRNNYGKLPNIKKPEEFKVDFNGYSFRGYEEKAFRILEEAKRIIEKYNIQKEISIFASIKEIRPDIREIIEKELNTK